MPTLDRFGGFPFAPEHWDVEEARSLAGEEGIELSDDHWNELRALQEYCSRHDCNKYSLRELHDALDEKFHDKGRSEEHTSELQSH